MTTPLVYAYTMCMKKELSSYQASRYAIRVEGFLDPQWEWLAGLTVTHVEPGETIICGPMADQAALHGLLARIRDLNLTLLSVEQGDSGN